MIFIVHGKGAAAIFYREFFRFKSSDFVDKAADKIYDILIEKMRRFILCKEKG